MAQEVLIRERMMHLDQIKDELQSDRVKPVIEQIPGGGLEHDFSALGFEHMRDLGLIAQGGEIWIPNPVYAGFIRLDLTLIML